MATSAIFGIGLSIMGKGEGGRITTKLPLKEIIGAIISICGVALFFVV